MRVETINQPPASLDLPHLPEQQWRDRALCRDDDPEQLQPELPRPGRGRGADELDAVRRAAVEHCIGCPVMHECMSDAEQQEWPYGTWGGRWWEGAATDIAVEGAPEPTRLRRVA